MEVWAFSEPIPKKIQVYSMMSKGKSLIVEPPLHICLKKQATITGTLANSFSDEWKFATVADYNSF